MKPTTIRGLTKFHSYHFPPIRAEEIEKELRMKPETLHGLRWGIVKKFKDWYPENMHIVNAFSDCADLLRIDGRREYYSARAIFEHLRWNTLFEDTDDKFKITDNICAPLARTLMSVRPRFNGMFKLRGLKERKIGG